MLQNIIRPALVAATPAIKEGLVIGAKVSLQAAASLAVLGASAAAVTATCRGVATLDHKVKEWRQRRQDNKRLADEVEAAETDFANFSSNTAYLITPDNIGAQMRDISSHMALATAVRQMFPETMSQDNIMDILRHASEMQTAAMAAADTSDSQRRLELVFTA